jgi:hypothetical protein
MTWLLHGLRLFWTQRPDAKTLDVGRVIPGMITRTASLNETG